MHVASIKTSLELGIIKAKIRCRFRKVSLTVATCQKRQARAKSGKQTSRVTFSRASHTNSQDMIWKYRQINNEVL